MMREIQLFAAVFLAGCATPTTYPRPEFKAALASTRDSYIDCALQQALRLDRANEPAETTARAAMTACSKERSAAARIVLDSYPLDMAQSVNSIVDKAVFDHTVSMIVQKRANPRRPVRPRPQLSDPTKAI